MANNITLKVRGLSDAKDASKIKKHLDDLSGISKVSTDLQDGEIKIAYNSQSINTATMVSKIEEMGYDVIQSATKTQN